MTKRYLPIYQRDLLLPNPQLVLRCMMRYPEDRVSALGVYNLLSDESNDIKRGNQENYSEFGLKALKEINRHTPLYRLCGCVAITIRRNLENDKKVNLEKTVYLVSEYAQITKSRSGKPLPSDASRLRKTFIKIKSMIHFWAAFELLNDQEMQNILESEDVFQKVMQLAFNMQNFFEQKNAFPNWDPWRVPEQYIQSTGFKLKYVSPSDETDWTKDKLSNYFANVVRM